MTLKTSLQEFALFASRLLKAPLSSLDYVILTPPRSRKCLVLNKHNGEIEAFHTGQPLDHWTISQIYIEQDYKIDHLKRHEDIKALLAKRQSLGQRSLILDAGVNIGASARYLAKHWPGVDLWGIEPSRRNIDLATRNSGANTRLIRAALGAKDGSCFITNTNALPNAFRVEACAEFAPESCPMVSMKSVMSEIEASGLLPFILKVDIEGAEAEVFKDAKDWLPQWPVLMIELHDWMLPSSGSSTAVLSAVAAGGRDVILKGNTIISIANSLV